MALIAIAHICLLLIPLVLLIGAIHPSGRTWPRLTVSAILAPLGLWGLMGFSPIDFLLPIHDVRLPVSFHGYQVDFVHKANTDFYFTAFQIHCPHGEVQWVGVDVDGPKWWNPYTERRGDRVYYLTAFDQGSELTPYLDLQRGVLFTPMRGGGEVNLECTCSGGN